MRRRWLILVALLLAGGGACATLVFLITCSGHITLSYRPVSGPKSSPETIVVREAEWPAPNHIIRDGELHLLVQATRSARVLVTCVLAVPQWTETAVAEYRQLHPDLESYWPDVTQPGAGVTWLREER